MPARTRSPRRGDRLTLWVLAIAFGIAAAIATAGPGVTATSTDGPITVTASPTEGIADGQHVAVHAEASGGSQIFELRAHVCQHDAKIDNTSEFGFQGPYCPNGAIGAGQFDEGVRPPSGSTTADLEFAVGMGGITWLDEQGYVHSLTCGPGNPCDLIVQVQVTNDTVYATFPLLIGEGAAPPPPTQAPVAAAGTGSGDPAAPATTPAAATPKATAAGGPAAGKIGSSDAPAGSGGATGSAARRAANGTGDGGFPESIANAVEAAVVGEPHVSQSVRVFCGGVAGVIGGALVVLIVARARRRMIGQIA